MGGSESSHLAIQLESNIIQAGNELSGVIHFHLLSPIHAESLCLKLSGKEKVMWKVSMVMTTPLTTERQHY
jgi:hypothetical protein